MTDRPEVLFLCVHNAGRSQMAAGFARELGGDHVVVHSAGSAPGEMLNPAVVEVMREKGIDISNEAPRKLTNEMGLRADVIVTMGCGDACPVYPGKSKRFVRSVTTSNGEFEASSTIFSSSLPNRKGSND